MHTAGEVPRVILNLEAKPAGIADATSLGWKGRTLPNTITEHPSNGVCADPSELADFPSEFSSP